MQPPAFVVGEKPEPVLANGTADSAAEAVVHGVRFADAQRVVGPAVGVRYAVLDVPYRRSMELIRSRTGCDLDGAISAAEFGIHGRYNQSNFAHEVLIHDRRRIDARRLN